jgi:hypothetical protein
LLASSTGWVVGGGPIMAEGAGCGTLVGFASAVCAVEAAGGCLSGGGARVSPGEGSFLASYPKTFVLPCPRFPHCPRSVQLCSPKHLFVSVRLECLPCPQCLPSIAPPCGKLGSCSPSHVAINVGIFSIVFYVLGVLVRARVVLPGMALLISAGDPQTVVLCM